MCEEPFSRRNQYAEAAAEITIREGAPESLRVTVLETVRTMEHWTPTRIRRVLCGVLGVRADQEIWTDYPNVWDEVQYHMHRCDWYKVYDFIEAIHTVMSPGEQDQFEAAINACFFERGIGWQFSDGKVVTRGTEDFETVVRTTVTALGETNRPTAAGHVHNALLALSRRPDADPAGAIYHAMGALEAVARDLTDNPQATLGEILRRNPDLLPPPLNTALPQLWGYASNVARHVREGHAPQRNEAELIVGLAAALATYLTRRQPNAGP